MSETSVQRRRRRAAWRNGLKVGDPVAVVTYEAGEPVARRTESVYRLTPRRIVLGDGTKYSKSDGLIFGGQGAKVYIRPPGDDDAAVYVRETREIAAERNKPVFVEPTLSEGRWVVDVAENAPPEQQALRGIVVEVRKSYLDVGGREWTAAFPQYRSYRFFGDGRGGEFAVWGVRLRSRIADSVVIVPPDPQAWLKELQLERSMLPEALRGKLDACTPAYAEGQDDPETRKSDVY